MWDYNYCWTPSISKLAESDIMQERFNQISISQISRQRVYDKKRMCHGWLAHVVNNKWLVSINIYCFQKIPKWGNIFGGKGWSVRGQKASVKLNVINYWCVFFCHIDLFGYGTKMMRFAWLIKLTDKHLVTIASLAMTVWVFYRSVSPTITWFSDVKPFSHHFFKPK